MEERYQDPGLLALMLKATFLDPRFKNLAHLPATTVENVAVAIQREIADVLQQDSAEVPGSDPTEDCECTEELPAKKTNCIH